MFSQPKPEILTAREALRLGAERLARAGVESPQLEMSLMLGHALGISRLALYTDLDRPLSPAERDNARELLARRVRREPLAYLTGEREFFGLGFEVTPDVLIPRPETEHLVEAAIEWLEAERAARPEPLLADIGVGSGAIAVAVAHACPWTRWIATDISPGALAVARRNAERHGVAGRIEFRLGTLWEPLDASAPFDAICSNPPYIPEADRPALAPEVASWEPGGALFAGAEGFDALRPICEGAPGRLKPGGLLLLECGMGQAGAVAGLLEGTGAFGSVTRIADLAGIERVIRAALRAG